MVNRRKQASGPLKKIDFGFVLGKQNSLLIFSHIVYLSFYVFSFRLDVLDTNVCLYCTSFPVQADSTGKHGDMR